MTLRKQLYLAIQDQMLCAHGMMCYYTEAQEGCHLKGDGSTGTRGLGQHSLLCITQDTRANGNNISKRSLFTFDVLTHALSGDAFRRCRSNHQLAMR